MAPVIDITVFNEIFMSWRIARGAGDCQRGEAFESFAVAGQLVMDVKAPGSLGEAFASALHSDLAAKRIVF